VGKLAVDSNVAKNLLINYRFYLTNLKVLEEAIKNLEEEIDGLRAQDYSKEKIRSQGDNTLEKMAVKLADMKLKLRMEKIRVQAIEAAVAELDDIDRQIIELKYMNKNSFNCTWKTVSKTIGYDPDHCRKRRDESFKKIAIVLDGIIA
jgi:RinA family phage transcriptional activator